MRTPRRLFVTLLVVVGLLVTLAVALERRARRPAAVAAELDVAAVLGKSAESDPQFARAIAPRPFHFPADHGAHDGFRTEWWYVTANLFAADGRAFGVQLTFFRNALSATLAPSASSWRSAHVWMAHFALSDERRGTFRFAERFAREAVGLAGVTAIPFRVAVEDWTLQSRGDSFSPLRLAAREKDWAIDLTLDEAKPPVLQGDRGLSQKGPEPGNASYYYSLTRLPTSGTILVDGETIAVTGASWLDREWSTSALGGELAGWDWFALQLGDGSELMFYSLRRKDGASDSWSRGSLVAPDGSSRGLLPGEIHLSPLSHWTSPGGATYPARWRLSVPGEGLELELTPRVAGQELAVTVRYWEGAVEVRGTRRGQPLAGHGFVEMTGYSKALSTGGL